MARIIELVDTGLAQGAIAIGVGPEYQPGTTHSEVLEMFRLAAEHGAFVFVHARDWDATRDWGPLYELIAATTIPGAPLSSRVWHSWLTTSTPNLRRLSWSLP